jgi:hypothetical protein
MYKYDYGLLLEDLWRSNVTYGRTKEGYINLNGPVVKVDIIDPDYDIRNLVVYKSKGEVKDETFTKYIVKKYSKDRYEDLQDYLLELSIWKIRAGVNHANLVISMSKEDYGLFIRDLTERKIDVGQLECFGDWDYDYKRFYNIIKGGINNIDNLQILDYRVIELNKNFIQIGCHKIEFKEINKIANELSF